MRRAFVLLLLLVGMQYLYPLGTAGQGSLALLAFGFLILAAYTVGEIATDLSLPKIVGYMAAGILFGPHVLQIVSAEAAGRLAPINDLAIALIAFLAGAELRWAEVRDRGVALLKIMTVELSLAFVLLAAAVFLMRDLLPFMASISTPEVIVGALLFAIIGIAHSPAATMALLSETGARGPVARSTLSIVLLSDIFVVLGFTGVLTLARFIVPAEDGTAAVSLGMVAWEIGGALLIGTLLGAGVARYLRLVGREPVLFGILIVFFGAEITAFAHVETLLTLLVAGFVVENASSDGRGEMLRHALERASAPLFVVFFALSGAAIDLGLVGVLIVPILPLVLIRGGAIWAGVRIGSRWAHVPREEGDRVWMGLISQAGVAIGLAGVLGNAYPGIGGYLRTMLLALIAINQLVGPILFRRALVAGGEVGAPARAAEPEPASAH